MNKYFKDNAQLTDEGKQVLKPLSEALEQIFGTQTVKDMSVQEIETLASNMAKMVADFVFDKKIVKNEIVKKFNEMTDEQFEAYLKAKYGPQYMLVGLTKEELDRVPPLSKEDLKKAMEEGRQAYKAVYESRSGVRLDPSLRFK